MPTCTVKWRGKRSMHVVLLVVMMALVSCSTRQPAADSTSRRGSASPTASPTTSVKPSSSPTTLPSTASRTVRLDQVETDRVALRGGGGPDWMVTGFGSLWVRRDNAVIARLSPDGRVQATIDAGIWRQPVCQGLGVSDKAVWGCATSGKLMRVDPRTNKVTAIVDVPKVNEQGRLVSYGGRVWVLTGDGDRLVGVSESTNRPGRPIRLGTYCTDVADTVLGATLWIACPVDGVVLRVDLQAGKVTGRVDGLPHAGAVSAGRDVWVCTDDGVARVDASSLSVTALQPVVGGEVGGFCSLRLSTDRLWVRTPTTFVTGIATSTGRVAEVVTAPGPSSGGDVIEFQGALWVSAFDRAHVYKLERSGL